MPRLQSYRDPGWFSESEAWNRYCAAINRGASDVVIQRYRDRYERVVAARARFRDEQRKWAEWPRANPVAIVLAPPRLVTSTAIAKMSLHGMVALWLTAISMLSASLPMLAVGGIVAPLLIYIWWRVTGATIRVAAQFDEHPIPPARVLSEGPR
jgi:hypothetical protein